MSECPACRPIKSTTVQFLAKMPDVQAALRWSVPYISTFRLLAHKPAICLDIDGTVLLNHEENGESYCVKEFKTLCELCVKMGVKIFIVTARPDGDDQQTWTIGQLNECGIKPVEQLFMRPRSSEYANYKASARQEIRNMGHSLLLSVGDQWADLLATKPRLGLTDSDVYVGTFPDVATVGIKLPSEFI